MIFIPFGVNQNDQNRYELTQYINDVTTQNTQVLMEYSNESGITAYTYGNERLSYETNGENYQYNYDGRGSVTNILDNTGASVVEYNYQPFGETEILGTKAQELENTYQFNAESTDALTGLQYLRARYYDSKTGRFTSADTYLVEITDPLSRNLYLYTKNDPVNYVNPSGHIFESMMKIADTAKDLYIKASEEAIKRIEEASLIPNIMKNMATTAIKTQVSKTLNKYENRKSTTKPTIEAVIENINKNEPASPARQAAINEKVEYAKALEQKIKECRSLNTIEANRIAEELEYQMRLLCDDNLDRVDVQKSAEKITSIVMESVQRKMQETSDTGFSAVVGFASTLVLDTVEFAGGMLFATSYALQGKNPGEGYSLFNNRVVSPVRNLIEENIPDKQAYNVGEIAGNVVEIFEAGKGIYKIATKGIPQIKNIVKMIPEGGNGGTAVLSKTLAIVGEVAETVKNVGVVEGGTAAEVTFAGKLGENIQEFSASGNGGNETGNVTRGSNTLKKQIQELKTKTPQQLLNEGWQDVTNQQMAANTNSIDLYNPETGLKIRFDKGVDGATGYEALDHYHIYNNNYTNKKVDYYLDVNGNPVGKGTKASHIVAGGKE